MDQPKHSANPLIRPSMSPDIRISVTNFGPIASGTIDLRPLTVFVGPSNTGKTYFAILIYALHRAMGGFSRFPARSALYYRPRPENEAVEDATKEAEFQKMRVKLESEESSLKFSDLPKEMRDSALDYLKHPGNLGADLRNQLLRCFDLQSITELNQSFGTTEGMKISVSCNENDRALWRFNTATSQSDIVSDGDIEEVSLLRRDPSGAGLEYDPELRRLFSEALDAEIGRRIDLERRSSTGSEPVPGRLLGLLGALNFDLGSFSHTAPRLANYPVGDSTVGSTYYLPAARSGIMQSHRVIASSLVARATRAGFERFELPTFSGVMADFMERLILYEEGRKGRPFIYLPSLAAIGHRLGAKDERPNEEMNELADALEKEVLEGQIQASKTSPGAYPEFVYRPLGAAQDIRLSRASSMVCELAPVILFLRSVVEPGDMLFIEEPEAHLHPAAQTSMAVALARLVRAGVRVIITTHSDWLLQEIGNLIREGELEEQTGNSTDDERLPSSLRPSEAGIWLFHRDGESAASNVKEIPFQRGEGVEPEEYEDVAEQLYNRSADLQNRLQELAGDAERDDI